MAYYRGDYYRLYAASRTYRGDYYRGHGRGDPFWGALLKGIGMVAKNLIGIPSAAAPTASTPPFAFQNPVFGAMATSNRDMPFPPNVLAPMERLPPLPPSPLPGGLIPSKRVPIPTTYVPGVGLVVKKRRHMNAGNVKALRRSIRRVVSFGKLCSSARGAVGKAATQLQYGGRRRSSSRAIATVSARSR